MFTIVSALITKCRRKYGDIPKSVQVARQGNGTINLFNLARFPVIENSYSIYVANSLRAASAYTLDLDSGDLLMNTTPSNGQEVKSIHKYAHFRDQNWVEAINEGIEELNARGFFRQVARQSFTISAGVRVFSGPSACVDMYEVLYSPTSGSFNKLPVNWSYQQDANKLILGNTFTTAYSGVRSYLRNLQTYNATSATVDVLKDWEEAVMKKAGAIFMRSVANKIAKQGNATIEEGHFSFSNLRTAANDLDADFERFAARKKPTRPAKDLQWALPGGGNA